MFLTEKKRCSVCGCYMYHEMLDDICECCLDELIDSDLEEESDEC